MDSPDASVREGCASEFDAYIVRERSRVATVPAGTESVETRCGLVPIAFDTMTAMGNGSATRTAEALAARLRSKPTTSPLVDSLRAADATERERADGAVETLIACKGQRDRNLCERAGEDLAALLAQYPVALLG